MIIRRSLSVGMFIFLTLVLALSAAAQPILPPPPAPDILDTQDTPLLLNGGFETAGATKSQAANWTTTQTAKQLKRVCNKPDRAPLAQEGSCAFRFFAQISNVPRRLKQVVATPMGAAGDTLTLSYWVKGNAVTGTSRVQVRVKYADNTKKKLVVPVATGTYAYTEFTGSLLLTGDVTKIVVRLIGVGSGQMDFDAVNLSLVPANVAPVANDDSFNVSVGTVNTANSVATNDSLGNPAATVADYGDPGTRGVTPGTPYTLPSSGGITVTLDAAGGLTVDADEVGAQTGTYTFEYQLSNSVGSDTAVVTLNVQTGPIAQDDAFIVTVGNTLNADLTADNGSGADVPGVPPFNSLTFGGGDLGGTVTSNTAPATVSLAGGNLTINADGTLSLVNPTVAGIVSFQYRLSSAIPASDDATVTIEVRKAPTAAADGMYVVGTSGTLTITPADPNDLLDNDDRGFPLATLTSFGGGNLGGAVTDNAAGATVTLAGGNLTVNADGSFTFATPDTAGVYTFDYRLTNVIGTSDATVTIQVQQSPVAYDDAFNMLVTGTLNADLTTDHGSGADVPGVPPFNSLTFGGGDLGGTVTDNTAPATVTLAGGNLTINADGTFSLVNPTVAGIVTFQYRLSNTIPASDDATVTIEIRQAPTANADGTYIVGTGGTLTITPAAPNDLLDNDDRGFPLAILTSFGGGDLGGSVTDNAAGATVTLAGGDLTVNANGGFTFAAPNAAGTYTFDYRLANLVDTSDATVTIQVQQSPVAQDDAFNMLVTGTLNADLTTDHGSGADVPGVPPFNSLTFGGGDLGGTVTDHTAPATVTLAGGSLTISADGTFSLVNPTVAGTVTFQYRLSSAIPASDDATVTIEIRQAPIAQDDTNLIAAVGVVTDFPAPTLFNDNGSGADSLGVPAATVVNFGGGDITGSTVVTDFAAGATTGAGTFAGGTLTVNADGSFSLNNPTDDGTFTFLYRIENAVGFDDALVTVTIQQGPTAQPDAFTFLYTADQTAPNGLFADNGSGVDDPGTPAATLTSFGGGSLGGTVADNAAGDSVPLADGTLTVNADGSWTFTGQPFTPGTYTFDYKLENVVGTSVVTVTLNIQQGVTAVDDASYTVVSGNTLTINTSDPNDLLDNDTLGFPAGSIVSFGGGSVGGTVVTNPAGTAVMPIPGFIDGSLTVNANGSFTFTPPTLATRFCGNFTFEYRLQNGVGFDDATVTITVQCAPVAEDDTIDDGWTSSASGYSVSGDLYADNGNGTDFLGNPAGAISSFGGGNLGGTVTTNAPGAGVALAGGTLTVNADGTFSLVDADTPGTYTFEYRLSNTIPAFDDAVVTLVLDAPPRVTSTNPTDGAVNVQASSNIVINFSENVDIAANGITVECPTGTNIAFAPTLPLTNINTITIDPDASLPGNETCTVTVVAANVTDTDTFDPPNQLDGNADNIEGDNYVFSFQVAPEAVDDSYTVTPHLTYDSSIPGLSVLDNDNPPTVTITGFGNTLGTANETVPNGTNSVTAGGAGGRVILNADGTFVFYPDAGAESPDAATFFYTITGGDTAQVTIDFDTQELVWFVDNTPGTTVCTGTNEGTQACPAPQPTTIADLDKNGNTIFIASGNYTCGLTLHNAEIVVGDGSSSNLQTISGVTPVEGSSFAPYDIFSGTKPVLTTTTSAVSCFTLAKNNTIRGLTIGNVGGGGTGDASDIIGTDFGTLNLLETTLNGTGRALSLTTGTLNGQLDALTVTASTTQGVLLSNVAGSLTVGSATSIAGVAGVGIRIENGSSLDANFADTTINKTTSGNAIVLSGNTSASDITFGGAAHLFKISNTEGSALVATNHDGSISTSGYSAYSDISAKGACFDIGGPAGLTSINIQVDTCTVTSSTTYGIYLQNTTGALFKVENATTISSAGGTAESIMLYNADTTTIDISTGSTVTVTSRRNEGIHVSDSGGTVLTFGSVTINNPNNISAAAIRLNGNTVPTTFAETNINQGNVGGMDEFGGNTFPSNNNGSGDAISVNNHTGGLTINGGTIENVSDDGIDIRASSNLTLNNVTINHGLVNLSGITAIQAYNLSGTNNINNSTLQNVDNPAVCVGSQTAQLALLLWDGSSSGTVNFTNTTMTGNAIGGVCNGGVQVFTNSSGTVNVNVGTDSTAMTMRNFFSYAVFAQAQSATGGTLNLDVRNLDLPNTSTGGSNGVRIQGQGNGNLTFDIHNNRLNEWADGSGAAIWVTVDGAINAGDGISDGLVSNITNNSITDTVGARGNAGIVIELDEQADLDLNLTGNTVNGVSTVGIMINGLTDWMSGLAQIRSLSNNVSNVGNNVAVDIVNNGSGTLRMFDSFNTYNGSASIQGAFRFASRKGVNSYIGTNNTYTAGPVLGASFQSSGPGGNTPSLCLDLNDDGGGGNISNGIVRIQQSIGTINAENGNTPAAFQADNPGVTTFELLGTVTTFVGECATPTP